MKWTKEDFFNYLTKLSKLSLWLLSVIRALFDLKILRNRILCYFKTMFLFRLMIYNNNTLYL